MDNKIVSILEHILAAIEDGRVAIYIGGNEGYEEKEPDLGMLPMLASNVNEYIKEHHARLHNEFVKPIAICENGDVLIRTTEKGFQYYIDNKEELFTDIYLKCGATRVYLHLIDIGEGWVQYEKDSIVKDIGQIPDFGTQPMSNQIPEEQEIYVDEEATDDLISRPLLTLEELVGTLPPTLSEVKLHVTDLGQIMQVIQNRLTTMTFEKIEDILYH
jgi:hypothetical protein